MKELLTFILPVVGVGSAVAVKFFIRPIYSFRKIIGEIDASLIYCAKVYSNKPDAHDEETLKETSEKLRMLASELGANANAVPWYSLFVKFSVIPERTQVSSAVKNLIGLSNFQANLPQNSQPFVNEIRAALRLPK